MRNNFDEYLRDSELGIYTTGRNDRHSTRSRFPYEPTPYAVLDALINTGYINERDILLDYGCGKGRVPIYLHSVIGCSVVGIDVEPDFCKEAMSNVSSFLCRNSYNTDENGISIIQAKAQTYRVPDSITCCYFFNPFSIDVFKNVLDRIRESMVLSPRTIRLFFYYISSDYEEYLSGAKCVTLKDIVDCTDLFTENDDRNKITIYEMSQ